MSKYKHTTIQNDISGMLFWQWIKILRMQTLSKQHEHDIITCTSKLKIHRDHSVLAAMEIIDELGIMNMEHYQFVKKKHFCRY